MRRWLAPRAIAGGCPQSACRQRPHSASGARGKWPTPACADGKSPQSKSVPQVPRAAIRRLLHGFEDLSRQVFLRKAAGLMSSPPVSSTPSVRRTPSASVARSVVAGAVTGMPPAAKWPCYNAVKGWRTNHEIPRRASQCSAKLKSMVACPCAECKASVKIVSGKPRWKNPTCKNTHFRHVHRNDYDGHRAGERQQVGH